MLVPEIPHVLRWLDEGGEPNARLTDVSPKTDLKVDPETFQLNALK